ncbi:Hypothetical predicted protein, partial [Pelobates cultripes]
MPVTIKCVSINAQGLNSPSKRHSLLRWAYKLKTDILFVQETHFTTQRTFTLTNRYYNRSYLASSPNTKTKGVAILIRSSCPITGIHSTADPQGRFLTITGYIGTNQYAFSTIYAPTTSDPNFWPLYSTHLRAYTN